MKTVNHFQSFVHSHARTFTIIALFVTIAASALASPLIVCLDPGHTSETSQGTESRDHKLTERHVNWIVALQLRRLLEARGVKVVMTKKSEGEIVTNRRRAEIANAARADLFLRLHCDAGAPAGFATFYPDRQGTRFGVTGPSRDVMAKSHHAAQIFHAAAIAALSGALANRGIKGDSATGVGGKQGALTGSIFSHVPALTIEMCVLSDDHDYQFIRARSGEEKMAQALLAGVAAYSRDQSKDFIIHAGN